MDHKKLIDDLLKTVDQFNDRKLWKRFSGVDCVGVRLPDRNESLLAVVMGGGGQECGVSLFRGPDAGATVRDLFDPAGSGDDAVPDADLLGFSMEPFGQIPLDGQEMLRQAGMHPRHDQPAPQFMVKPPGHQPRMPGDAELELLLRVLRGMVEADQKKLLKPATLDDECGICILTVDGAPDALQVALTRAPWPRPAESYRFPVASGKSAELRGLPRIAGTWLAGLLASPTGVEGDERMPRLLLVAEDETGERILQATLVMPDEFDQAIGGMVNIFRGRGANSEEGMPAEILFSSRKLCSAMQRIVGGEGVVCRYEPDLPVLHKIAEHIFGHMAQEPELNPVRSGKPAKDAPIPAPDDLAGWKEADRELARRFNKSMEVEVILSSARAVKRYFGEDDIVRYFEEHRECGIIASYATWAVLHYRATKTGKTHAEKMLAMELPQAQAILLRARMDSHPTLYRVAKHDARAGTVTLEDALLGRTVTVHDRMMSENIDDGLFLAAQTFAAGNFHFLDPAGPPLGAGMGLEAAEFLRDEGVELTPEGLRRDAHKFGWLWDWSDQWQNRFESMRLANMDGDELLWHTASFAVSDMADTRIALLARKDIQQEENDALVWSMTTGKAAKSMGGSVLMGRIELLDDELVLTVNSAQRLAKARKWIDKLPGVVFRNVTTRSVNPKDHEMPPDDQMGEAEPMELTPDMAAGIQQMMTKHYMEWLDKSLPVLNGLTPRQACRTAAGRQQVTLLIRTTPDPMGPMPVHVPRQAMLRALGLDDQTPPSAAPPAGMESPAMEMPGLFGEKVGRNEPCPCGSGRKFKKCCGH